LARFWWQFREITYKLKKILSLKEKHCKQKDKQYFFFNKSIDCVTCNPKGRKIPKPLPQKDAFKNKLCKLFCILLKINYLKLIKHINLNVKNLIRPPTYRPKADCRRQCKPFA